MTTNGFARPSAMKRSRTESHTSRPPAAAAAVACALCERRVGRVSKHHTVPKSEGGTETVDLCSTCHKTLHKFFTNRTLAREMNTVEALRRNEEVRRYVNWVRKQPDRQIRVRASRRRR